MWPTVNNLLRDRQQLLQSFHDVYFHGNTEDGQLRSLWLCQIDPRVALVPPTPLAPRLASCPRHRLPLPLP